MTDDAPVTRADLPIPEYDHLPVTGLAHRIRSLTAQQLSTLLAYEEAHGNRLPVVQVLEARLDEVRSGAELFEGDASATAPKLSSAPDARGPVAPVTPGPPQSPPAHGVPTNPAQPRT